MKENAEQKKKRNALIIMILTLIVSVVGATYAFFSISPTANNAITGKAATVNLSLDIHRIAPNQEDWTNSNKVIIPQLSSNINTAMNSCIDENGDVVCQVYQIKVTNQGTAQVVVDGDIIFTGTQNMPNLRWKIYESNIELTGTNISNLVSSEPTKTITEAQNLTFTQDVTLTPNMLFYGLNPLSIQMVLQESKPITEPIKPRLVFIPLMVLALHLPLHPKKENEKFVPNHFLFFIKLEKFSIQKNT